MYTLNDVFVSGMADMRDDTIEAYREGKGNVPQARDRVLQHVDAGNLSAAHHAPCGTVGCLYA